MTRNEKLASSYMKLNGLRESKGVSFYKVAQDTGLSPMVFSDWKSGKSMPKADKLIKIANFFDVPVETFIS